MHTQNELTKQGRVWSLTVFPKDTEEIWPANGYPKTLNHSIQSLITIPSTVHCYTENYPQHPWGVEEMDIKKPQGGVIIVQAEKCPDTKKLHYQVGIRMAKNTRGSFIKRYVLPRKPVRISLFYSAQRKPVRTA